MAYNTQKYTARKRAAEYHANMKAEKERDIERIIEIAVKRYDGNGTKGRSGVVMLTETPEAQITALDQYISDLRDIGEELSLRYGPGIERRLWRIKHEIDTAIEAIAKLRLDQVKPGA